MPWHMLHLNDLQEKPITDQLHAFAEAYLESAHILCESLCTHAGTATYAHGAVIMSLTFHSLELFLKSAILQKAPNETFSGRNGHDLEYLEQRYANLYPGNKYKLDIIFKRKPPDLQGIDPQVAKELITYAQKLAKDIPEDQRHRYPVSTEGKPWPGLFGFEPNTFCRDIEKLKSEFARLVPLLQNS